MGSWFYSYYYIINLLLLLLLLLLKHLTSPCWSSKECCCQARPLERASLVESQTDKRQQWSYLLDAGLNDSKSSRETREMKGRDSPCWWYYPVQWHLPSALTPGNSRRCHPAAFVAAAEASRSFRAGESLGGRSSGPEQGAAGTIPEPLLLAGKGGDLGAKPMVTEGQEAIPDWREIFKYKSRDLAANVASSRLGLGFPHVSTSVAAFTTLLWLLACLPLPRGGSDLSILTLHCCSLRPALLLHWSPFCS